MKITVELPASLEERLANLAQRLDVSVETLAEIALRDLFGSSDEDFTRAASRLLEKNDELYRRLA